MARFTKRQLITGFSAFYLLLITILAAYALHQNSYYSLPIPNSLSALAVALPPLAGVALETIITFQSTLAAKGKLQNSKVFQTVNAAFLVYETVLATLAGTHIAPLGGLWCPLHDQWSDLFRKKDGESIKAIQDAFNCCGFKSVKDMAFPFKDKTHGDDWCVVRYERDTSCIDPWRAMERRIAIIMMVVPLAVFLWKVALFLTPGLDTPWLPSAIRLPNDNSDNTSGRQRQAITFRDVEEGEADSLRAEVARLNSDSNLASRVEGGRVRPSPLIQEAENNNLWTEN